MSHRVLVALAAILVLAGCGGGGGPSVDVSTDADYRRTNSNATDLLDTWNDPGPVLQALGTAPVPAGEHAQRIGQLRELLAGQAPGGDTLTRLRNVDPANMRIVGERDGITYGQWKAGPAGGLDIDFFWKFAPGFTARERAVVERAGKEWAYRLDDTIDGTFTVRAQDLTDQNGRDGTEPLHSKDLTVIMYTSDGYVSSGGTWLEEVSEDAYKARVATFHFVDNDRRAGDIWFRHIAAHELSHMLGFTGYLHERAPAKILSYFDFTNGTFNGPASVRANGGRPVPIQWLDANRDPVAPHTRGATIDFGHIAPCPSVNSYCGAPVTTPDELDFALLADLGYSVRPASVRNTPETYGYAAWGDWASWGVGVDRLLAGTRDYLRASADAFGVAPTTPLADNAELSGSVTWSGSLLGVDLSSGGAFAPVAGQAALAVDLATLDGQATFDQLRVSTPDGAVPLRRPSLSYAIAVEGNAFADTAGRVQGGFYGPAHEEMAGTLNDRTAGVELLAGFGGRR